MVIGFKDLLAIFHHLICVENTFIAYLKMVPDSSDVITQKASN
jgi:hypothetical protein